MLWNATSTACLFMATSDTDATNQSYYGESKVGLCARVQRACMCLKCVCVEGGCLVSVTIDTDATKQSYYGESKVRVAVDNTPAPATLLFTSCSHPSQ